MWVPIREQDARKVAEDSPEEAGFESKSYLDLTTV